jgi:hypothetical protein
VTTLDSRSACSKKTDRWRLAPNRSENASSTLGFLTTRCEWPIFLRSGPAVGERRCSEDHRLTRGQVMISHIVLRPRRLSTISLSLSVGKELFLSSSLSICFFFKALVGEHRALSYGAMIMTPPYSPDVSFAHSIAFTHTRIFFIHNKYFEHALLHESRRPCPRRICGFPCSPNSVRVETYTC